MSHPDVPLDPVTGVPFIDLENYCYGASVFVNARFFFAEWIAGAHGFSALIVSSRVCCLGVHISLGDRKRKSRAWSPI